MPTTASTTYLVYPPADPPTLPTSCCRTEARPTAPGRGGVPALSRRRSDDASCDRDGAPSALGGREGCSRHVGFSTARRRWTASLASDHAGTPRGPSAAQQGP